MTRDSALPLGKMARREGRSAMAVYVRLALGAEDKYDAYKGCMHCGLPFTTFWQSDPMRGLGRSGCDQASPQLSGVRPQAI